MVRKIGVDEVIIIKKQSGLIKRHNLLILNKMNENVTLKTMCFWLNFKTKLIMHRKQLLNSQCIEF